MNRDLLLRGAHIIDPSQAISRVMDIAIRDGVIAELGESLPKIEGASERDLSGCYLCPGLVDLHGHWYEGSAFGINPDLCLYRGSTTVVDAGTTGFINFPYFRRHTIATSRARVLSFVNIAACGIPTSFAGELEDPRYARPTETASVINEHADVTVGVKVRMMEGHSPTVLEAALIAARDTHLPLMVHVSAGADTRAILRSLRAGDILTHCFRGKGTGIVVNGHLSPDAIHARRDGVIFDVGHGSGSFSWDVSRRAFEHDFFPDTISTDLHRYSIQRWAFDMPTIMTKFLHLGMSLDEVILRTTLNPARTIGREQELGTLRVGTTGDLFVFTLENGEFPLEDSHLKIEIAQRRVVPYLVLRGGELIEGDWKGGKLHDLTASDLEFIQSIEQSA